jgi:hypothetical protein
LSLYFHKNITCLSAALLRIGQIFLCLLKNSVLVDYDKLLFHKWNSATCIIVLRTICLLLQCAFSNYISLDDNNDDYCLYTLRKMCKLTFVWRSMSQLSSKSSSSSPNGFINCSATYHRMPVITDQSLSNKHNEWELTTKRLVNSFTSLEQF